MKGSNKWHGIVRSIGVVLAILAFYIFLSGRDFKIKETTKTPASQTTTSTAEQEKNTTDLLPQVSPDDWELVLVNLEHPVETLPELGYVEGIPVDARIVEATTNLLAAVRLTDPDPLQALYSGYRSVDEQELLFQTRVGELLATGLSEEEATATVSQQVMPAGYSEHHTGLAIDLMRGSDKAAEIAELAVEYGFVLRYLDGKEAITGIAHEDWHFRYVGRDSARYMAAKGLTLEEYLEELRNR